MRVELASGDVTASRASVVVIPVCRMPSRLEAWWGRPDKRWSAPLMTWLRRINFRARVADVELCPNPHRPEQTFVFCGVGLGDEYETAFLLKGMAAGLRRALGCDGTTMDVWLQMPGALAPLAPSGVARAVRAIYQGAYQVMGEPLEKSIRLVTSQVTGETRKRFNQECGVGEIFHRVRTLANLPGNRATPDEIVRHVRQLKKRHPKLLVKVWGPSALRRMRCQALLAVGRGSRQPCYLIEIRHRGAGKGAPVALVGKTITFDSGGLSLKPPKSMEWMRYDKCGGMAVLAAVEALHVLKVKQPVVALLAVAENMPGGDAMRPGDVVKTRSGKTVEILNTDAEGRLVLADALHVACAYRPRCVVDLATLTGAATIALGKVYSALFGRPNDLLEQLRKAGQATGELVWPLPLHADYAHMLHSSFADLKNTGDGTAGAVAGAMFLRNFVPDEVPWAHLDLTHAWRESSSPASTAGATLQGAQLLVEWISTMDQKSK
jgi:leucyl aminopeptidase